MSVIGRLEDFGPSDLVQAIALLGKSGRLRVERGEREGLMVFRHGRIIYAASSSTRESLGSLLLRLELITEEELVEALASQEDSAEEKRLGSVLVEMGLLSHVQLEDVIRLQFSHIISEFIGWDSGGFRFDTMELEDHGEVALDAADFLIPAGMESTHVLLEAARRADEDAAETDAGSAAVEEVVDEIAAAGVEEAAREKLTLPEEPVAAESLRELLGEIVSPTLGGEKVYRLLEIASETCGRCVLLAVHPDDFRAVGHLGLDPEQGAAAQRLADLAIPRDEPGLLARAVEKRRSLMALLPTTDSDVRLLEAMGGGPQGKSLAAPVRVGDEIVLVLYGDRLLADLSTGWQEKLDLGLSEAARAMIADRNRSRPEDPVTIAPEG